VDLSVYEKTPAFNAMDTPVLKQKIDQCGLKPLSKKNSVNKLTEIHRFTNRKHLKLPNEGPGEVVTSKRKICKKSSELSNKPASLKDKYRAAKPKPASKPTVPRTTASKPTVPKPTASRSTVPRMTAKVVLTSSGSDSDDSCPVGDLTILNPSQTKKEATARVLKSLLCQQETLYLDILQYKPVDVITVKELLLSEKRHKVDLPTLALVLDEMGITFINSKNRARQTDKNLKTAQRTKNKKEREKKKAAV